MVLMRYFRIEEQLEILFQVDGQGLGFDVFVAVYQMQRDYFKERERIEWSRG